MPLNLYLTSGLFGQRIHGLIYSYLPPIVEGETGAVRSNGQSISDEFTWYRSLENGLAEARVTGKPVFIANILPRKNDIRFQRFRNLFRELNITRNLGEDMETWTYQKLDEANRVAKIIKERLNS